MRCYIRKCANCISWNIVSLSWALTKSLFFLENDIKPYFLYKKDTNDYFILWKRHESLLFVRRRYNLYKKRHKFLLHINAVCKNRQKFTVRKTVNTRKLLAQRTRTVQQDLTVPGNYWSASPWRMQKSPAILSLQDSESPEITSSKINYCPAGLTIPSNY